jgi:hypothetical protein
MRYAVLQQVFIISGTGSALCTAVILARWVIVLAYFGSRHTRFHAADFFTSFYLESRFRDGSDKGNFV